MRNILFTVFLALFIGAAGQSKQNNNPFSFGMSALVTLPTFATSLDTSSIGSQIDNNIGLGGSVWADYKLKKFTLYDKLSFRSFNYTNTVNNIRIISGDINMSIGAKVHPKKTDEIYFVFAYEPSYVLFANANFTGKKDSIVPFNIAPQISNRFSNGVYLGVQLAFKERNSVEFGYSHILNQDYYLEYIDAIPHHFRFTYNFNFSRDAEPPVQYIKMRESLNKLQSDTLYVINKACQSDFSNNQLDSLLNENYSFSSYKILDEQDLQNGSRINAVHYIIIGKHFASTSDPESNGIYFLDKNLSNTDFPYPYHTAPRGMGNTTSTKCIGGLTNAGILIADFNKRLYQKLTGT